MMSPEGRATCRTWTRPNRREPDRVESGRQAIGEATHQRTALAMLSGAGPQAVGAGPAAEVGLASPHDRLAPISEEAGSMLCEGQNLWTAAGRGRVPWLLPARRTRRPARTVTRSNLRLSGVLVAEPDGMWAMPEVATPRPTAGSGLDRPLPWPATGGS